MAGKNKCVKIWTYFKASYLIAQRGEMRIYILKAELKMDASDSVSEYECWFLNWTENAVKLQLKLTIQIKRKAR